MVGRIVTANEIQQWIDITPLFGEISNLNTVLDMRIYDDYNLILQRVFVQEETSPFRSHVILRPLSESMTKITENQFCIVHKFGLSDRNCDDLHYVCKMRMPTDWNLF
jgi:hypothetical protein